MSAARPGPLSPALLAFLLLETSTVALPARAKAKVPGSVVFVCQHGNVKSLIAQEWFNRLAAQRGLRVRGVARGVTPEAPVPPAVAAALLADGFEVSGFEPRAFAAADTARAVRVVAIGVDLPPSAALGAAPLETWNGIPPASEDYGAARDALRLRIEALLAALEKAERPR